VNEKLYHYRAELVRVIDGDTIDVDIDLGFDKIRTRQRLRLLGVDTPEKGEAGYVGATHATASRLWPADEIIVHTIRKDSFGRWLANVWYDGNSLNEALIKMGWPMKD
jgi:micrococcal nuclease